MELLYVDFLNLLLTKDAKKELLGIHMKVGIVRVYDWGWGCVQSWSNRSF